VVAAKGSTLKRIAKPPTDETRWILGARLTLWLAVVFILLNIAHLAYRMTIPSLGWAGPDPENLDVAEPYFQVETNAVGSPSSLQTGDLILAIEDLSAQQILTFSDIFENPAPPSWEKGSVVNLIVQRRGQVINLKAPLTHWTAAAWMRTNFGSFIEIWDWLVTLLLFGIGTFTFLKKPGN
jgi:hypothetical protein